MNGFLRVIPSPPPSWTRLGWSWLAAIAGSSIGASVAFLTSAVLRGGSGTFEEALAIALFCLIYAAIGTTVLGPATLVVLLAIGRVSATAFAWAGALSGLGGTLLLNAWGGYPQDNLFPETGALAGLCGALAFHRVWNRVPAA